MLKLADEIKNKDSYFMLGTLFLSLISEDASVAANSHLITMSCSRDGRTKK